MNPVTSIQKNQGEKIWGIVPAAGIGKRMMSAQPKQYLPLGAQRVLDYALLGLCRSDSVDGVVVGIRAGDEWWRAQPFVHPKLVAVSPGGAQRAHTVRNALGRLLDDHIAAEDDWIMVHDGARPCITQTDIVRLVAAARSHGGGAVLALPLADTLKRVDDHGNIETTLHQNPREGAYWRAVTPQMFRCGALAAALQQALEDGIIPRDESAAMERVGVKAVAVAGTPTNVKITLPQDLELARHCLAVARKNESDDAQ